MKLQTKVAIMQAFIFDHAVTLQDAFISSGL